MTLLQIGTIKGGKKVRYIFSPKGLLIITIFLLFSLCLIGCNGTSPTDVPGGNITPPVDVPEDTNPPVDEPEDTSPPAYGFGDSATDYIGLSVNRVIELQGDDYEVIEHNSTGLHYKDVDWVFYIGEILPEGFKFTGDEIIKFVDVFDGQVIKGIFIGDSAEEIANKLEMANFDLEVDHLNGGYFLGYETELNGYESYISFDFQTLDGPCIHAWGKSDELY